MAASPVLIRPRSHRRWLGRLTMLLALLAPGSAVADGMYFARDPMSGRHSLQREYGQLCFINCERGIEHMLLSVAVSDTNRLQGLWIVPIPAPGESVDIDILRGMPKLNGRNVATMAMTQTRRSLVLMSLSQLYPWLLWGPYITSVLRGDDNYDRRGAVGSAADAIGLDVHEHIERMGVTAEVVSCSQRRALDRYLTARDVWLPAEVQPVLDDYDTAAYSFVVSWISDSLAFARESLSEYELRTHAAAIGLSASFPTHKAFFPLRPTSVYGDVGIECDVFITGHVRIENSADSVEERSAWIDVQHHRGSDYDVPGNLRPFFGGRSRLLRPRFTRLVVWNHARNFHDDIWLVADRSFRTVLADTVSTCWPVAAVLLFLVCSCLASLCAGLVAYRDCGISWYCHALFGLWNALTLIALMVATLLSSAGTPRRTGLLEPLRREWHSGLGRKIAYLLLFTVFFDLMVIAAHAVVIVPVTLSLS